MTAYQFSDTDLAARRLAYLARVFEASTRPFVGEAMSNPPELAVDLGCGPGHTTHLLAEVTGCTRAVGLDSSESFVAEASRTATDRVTFLVHDVTKVPFPVDSTDLLYCRYLLTHLENPLAVLDSSTSQLGSDGLLLVEETEWIQTSEPEFSRYLEIVAAMLRKRSQELYIGHTLDGVPDSSSLKKRDSAVRQLAVTGQAAATMFHMNIQSWKEQPFIAENYGEEIGSLEQTLSSIAAGQRSAADVTWGLRQLVFQKLAPPLHD